MSRELHDERISAYLDDELSPGERAEMDELLKTSSSHQQELAELTSLRESLQAMPRYTLGDDFAARVTVAAQRAAEQVKKAPSRDLRPQPAAGRSGTSFQKWILAVAGGIAVAAASVVLIVSNWNGNRHHLAKVDGNETGKETVKEPNITEPAQSEFVRALSSTQENEAVVVRVRLTKDAIRGRLLDEALKAHGIQMATADVNNEAARQTSLAYKEQLKSQVASAGSRGAAADVLFLEANAEELEMALSDLEKNPVAKAGFALESLVASIGKGPSLAEKPEGEAGSAGTETKVPTGGYFQHLPPHGIRLSPAGSLPTTSSEKIPAKKSARVLIVVEVVD